MKQVIAVPGCGVIVIAPPPSPSHSAYGLVSHGGSPFVKLGLRTFDALAGVAWSQFTCTPSATGLPFAPASFDSAFLVAVLGEVPDASACVSSIAEILRPGGRLSISELPGDPDALSLAEVRELADAAGLEPIEFAPLFRGFIATFRRPGSCRPAVP